MADGQRRALESQRQEGMSQLERERIAQLNSLRASSKEKHLSIEMSGQERVAALEGQQQAVAGQISELESALSQLPEGHPQRGQLENGLKKLRRHQEMLRHQAAMLKSRMQSQKQMVNFQSLMRERMLTLKFGERKSFLLRSFAERVMQLQESQQRMAYLQQNSLASAGKRPTAGQEAGQKAG